MSKISVSCGSCGKRYAVPDSYAGKKFKCKDCGAAVSIPAPEEPEVPEAPEAEAMEEEAAPAKTRKRTASRKPPARRRPAPSRRRPTRASREEDEPEEAPAGARHGRGTGPRGRAGGGGSRSARRPTRRAAAAGAYDQGPPPNKNLLILSGVGCVVLVLGCVVYFGFLAPSKDQSTRKKPKKKTVAETQENPWERVNPDALEEEDPGFGDETNGKAEPEPEPAAAPTKEPEKKPEAKPEASQPKEEKLPPPPRANIRKLPHYDSTAQDQRTEIDELVTKIQDPWGGAKANRAKARLVKIGKPSVPALYSAMVDLDFTNKEHRDVMPLITEALYDITKALNSMVCRVGGVEEKKQVWICEYRRAEWFEWLDRRGREFLTN